MEHNERTLESATSKIPIDATQNTLTLTHGPFIYNWKKTKKHGIHVNAHSTRETWQTTRPWAWQRTKTKHHTRPTLTQEKRTVEHRKQKSETRKTKETPGNINIIQEKQPTPKIQQKPTMWEMVKYAKRQKNGNFLVKERNRQYTTKTTRTYIYKKRSAITAKPQSNAKMPILQKRTSQYGATTRTPTDNAQYKIKPCATPRYIDAQIT